MIVVHDGNWSEFAFIAQSTTGYCSAMTRQSECGKLSYARPYAEVMELIPPSQYESRFNAMIGRFARQRWERFNPIHQNQGPNPLCWAYSLAQHFEAVRAKMGLPYVQLAPESILGCNGYRNIGGFLDRALEWVSSNGMAPRSLVPQYAINPNTWNPEYKSAALNVVPLERFDLGTVDMWAECMTALLNGDSIYLAYDWLAHAMCGMELQKKGNEYGLWFPNTWKPEDTMLVFGQKKVPSEAYVVRAATYSR
jgi:hypothetical protein